MGQVTESRDHWPPEIGFRCFNHRISEFPFGKLPDASFSPRGLRQTRASFAVTGFARAAALSSFR
jgi:hypothetical protein